MLVLDVRFDHIQQILSNVERKLGPVLGPFRQLTRRSRQQPIGAALILFLKKHSNILSVYFSRLSSNCFPPYYIQPGRNILLLKIESSFQNQNKQKKLMSTLSCFARQRVIYDLGERSDTSMRVPTFGREAITSI
jgi:hypothetical protein